MVVSSGEVVENGLDVIGSKGLVYESGTAIGTIGVEGVAGRMAVTRRRHTRLRGCNSSEVISMGIVGVGGGSVGVAGRAGEEGTARSRDGNASLAGDGPPSIMGFGGVTSQHTVVSHHHVCLFVHVASHSACHFSKNSSESSSTSSPSWCSDASCSAAALSLMNSPRLPLRLARNGVTDDVDAARDGRGERDVDVGSDESLLRRGGRERRALRRRMRAIRSDSSSSESSPW